MLVDADPGKIVELAGIIRDCFISICNETTDLDASLKSFGSTIDEEAFYQISAKVTNLIKQLEDAQESVAEIYQNLIKYAEIVEEAQRAMNS